MKLGNFRQKFKQIMQQAGAAIFYVNWFFDLKEKESEIKEWNEPVISTMVLTVLIIAFFAVTFLPIRPIIVFVIFSKFGKDGLKHKNRYINNVECSRILIRNQLLRNKIFDLNELESAERQWMDKSWTSNEKMNEKILMYIKADF